MLTLIKEETLVEEELDKKLGFAHKLRYFKNRYVYKMDQCRNARDPRAWTVFGTWCGNFCDLDKLEHFSPAGRQAMPASRQRSDELKWINVGTHATRVPGLFLEHGVVIFVI